MQIFDYTLPDELKDLYSRDAKTIFKLIYRWIYSFVDSYKLDNSNLYETYDKDTVFYKVDITKALHSLHNWGTSLFYAIKYDRSNRIYGETIISKNLQVNLNDLVKNS